MQDAVLVHALLHVPGDGRRDSCRGPAFPDRSDARALLDPAGESDQRIPEVAFEFLPRRLAFRDREEEGPGHAFFLLRRVAIRSGLAPADRPFSDGAAPGPRAPPAGARPDARVSRSC